MTMPDQSASYLTREGRLTPGDAAAALVVLEDGRYLMQLRDQKHGGGVINRFYFQVDITHAQLRAARLGEGSALKPFVGVELLLNERVTPYDAFAIWMHITRR